MPFVPRIPSPWYSPYVVATLLGPDSQKCNYFFFFFSVPFFFSFFFFPSGCWPEPKCALKLLMLGTS